MPSERGAAWATAAPPGVVVHAQGVRPTHGASLWQRYRSRNQHLVVLCLDPFNVIIAIVVSDLHTIHHKQ